MTPEDDTPTEADPTVAAPPVPGAEWVQDHEPPRTEAERQAQETIRSLPRLEESN